MGYKFWKRNFAKLMKLSYFDLYMEALPGEVLDHILGFLDPRWLPSAMRVCKRWCSVGERLLYAETTLRFRSMLPRHYQDREVHHAMTLDGSHSIARAVRHLTIALDTFPTEEVTSMFMSILQKTIRLISLDIQTPLHHVKPILPQADNSFLPNLIALKASSDYVMAIAPGHTLEAICIDGFLHWDMVSKFSETLDLAPLRHLRLALDVITLDAAVEVMQSIAQKFRSVSHLVVQFRLPTTTQVTWELFTVSYFFLLV